MDPIWFDAAHYGRQKVLQMNKINWDPEWLADKGGAWTEDLYNQYLKQYRTPEGKPVSAYENFVACNTCNYAPEIEVSAVNVSGNPYFDVDYYANQVADWANQSGAYGKPAEAWTGDSVAAHIFNEHRMSLWEHFRTVGLEQRLNPSAQFDLRAYLAARAAAMNEAEGVSLHTIENAAEAIKASGGNAIMDLYEYGHSRGIKAQPVEKP